MPRLTKAELFLKLARPNDQGVSRWVKKSEFVGEYKDLYFENGCSRGRSDGPLAKKYILERRHHKGSVSEIRLNGFNNDETRQTIRSDIKEFYKNKRCVILGTSGPEVDHKDGRKNDSQVMNPATQKLEDFQPLSKAANDAKRQFCKECKKNNKRYDAKKLGYTVSFTEGTEDYDENVGCKGCFRYDPVAFRQKLFMRGNQNS